MDYALTLHAAKALEEREILAEWLERAMMEPEVTLPDADDQDLVHYLKRIPERGDRVLRVVLNRNAEPARVITVYFDRGMRGKL